MPPRVPHLGKAVTKDHREPFAGLSDVHLDAVGSDEGVFDFAHRALPEEVLRCGLVNHAASLISMPAAQSQKPAI
jgi:hypothetical protein